MLFNTIHACQTILIILEEKYQLYLVLNLIFVLTKDLTFKVWNELCQKSEIKKISEKKSEIESRWYRKHWRVRHCKLRTSIFTLLFLFNHISHRNFSSSNIILKLPWQMTCGFQIRKIVHKNLKLWTWVATLLRQRKLLPALKALKRKSHWHFL